jgi:hypothetical protein
MPDNNFSPYPGVEYPDKDAWDRAIKTMQDSIDRQVLSVFGIPPKDFDSVINRAKNLKAIPLPPIIQPAVFSCNLKFTRTSEHIPQSYRITMNRLIVAYVNLERTSNSVKVLDAGYNLLLHQSTMLEVEKILAEYELLESTIWHYFALAVFPDGKGFTITKAV